MSAKICFFDLETSNLNANVGTILTAAWKFLDNKKVHCVSIDQFNSFKKDPTNDKEVTKAVANALMESDIICGWYSARFDFPYLQSRLLFHGLKPLPKMPHIDLWRTAKYELKLTSNRLASVSDFLDLDDKTPIKFREWLKAMAGNKKSIQYIRQHNIQDILVLEQAYLKMRPLIQQHPNVNIVTGRTDSCPVCSVARLEARGYSIARTTRTPRFHCRSCGAWSKGRPQQIKGVVIR